MEEGKKIGAQQNLGRMDLIQMHVRDTRSAVVFSTATAETNPEMWEWLPGIHRDMIMDGSTLLFDVSGNGVHIPAVKPEQSLVAEPANQ